MEVASNGSVEAGDVNKEMRFDQGRDVRGPCSIAVAFGAASQNNADNA